MSSSPVDRALRGRQIIRAARQKPCPEWAKKIKNSDTAVARHLTAGHAAEPDEEKWPANWASNPKSLPAFLPRLRQWGQELEQPRPRSTNGTKEKRKKKEAKQPKKSGGGSNGDGSTQVATVNTTVKTMNQHGALGNKSKSKGKEKETGKAVVVDQVPEDESFPQYLTGYEAALGLLSSSLPQPLLADDDPDDGPNENPEDEIIISSSSKAATGRVDDSIHYDYHPGMHTQASSSPSDRLQQQRRRQDQSLPPDSSAGDIAAAGSYYAWPEENEPTRTSSSRSTPYLGQGKEELNSTAKPVSSSQKNKQNVNKSRNQQQEGDWEEAGPGPGPGPGASSSSSHRDSAEVRLVRVDDETHHANKKLLWKHMRWYAKEVKEGRIVPEPWKPKK